MSAAWLDPERWAGLCDGSTCPICIDGPLDVIAEFGVTWLTGSHTAQLPGYACVVSKRHVVEPFELSPDESAAFWSETMASARALTELFRPVKVNYGIHGNVIPHLHIHLWPRYVDDPYDVGGIPVGVASFTRTDEDLRRIGDAARDSVGRLCPRSVKAS